MPDAHKNFAYSTVATAPSPAASGTSLVVAAGDGAKFPTPPFNVTVWPIGVIPLATNAEIARCTAISTDTLTLARAQEGSSARTVIIGDQVAATITAKTLTDVENQLIYGGDYAAGNYVDGQIVVYNGIAYLCTSPTSVAPSAWPGGISPPAAPFTIAYGTSLPASPTDGQLAILVDSITNPSYQWKFRYNLGSTSPYKWEFVGGSIYSSGPTGALNNFSTTSVWTDLTSGPGLTVPRSGVYAIESNCYVQNNNAAGAYTAYSRVLASTTGSLGQPSMSGSTAYWSGFLAYKQLVTLVAAETLKMQIQQNNTMATNYGIGFIGLLPMRVA